MIYIYIYIYICICICIYSYIHACIHTYVDCEDDMEYKLNVLQTMGYTLAQSRHALYIHDNDLGIYVYIYLRLYVHAYIYSYIHILIHTHAHTYTCSYIHILIHTDAAIPYLLNPPSVVLSNSPLRALNTHQDSSYGREISTERNIPTPPTATKHPRERALRSEDFSER